MKICLHSMEKTVKFFTLQRGLSYEKNTIFATLIRPLVSVDQRRVSGHNEKRRFCTL